MDLLRNGSAVGGGDQQASRSEGRKSLLGGGEGDPYGPFKGRLGEGSGERLTRKSKPHVGSALLSMTVHVGLPSVVGDGSPFGSPPVPAGAHPFE